MIDWDSMRFLLAVANHRSMSAASRELRVAQSTVSRRIAVLESKLNVRLLTRTPTGYILTKAGEIVYERAKKLDAEAQAIVREVANRDANLAGPVTIACIEAVATNILAPKLIELHQRFPAIQIELASHSGKINSSVIDADICLYHTRPEHQDIVVRKVGDVSYGLYASPAYLAHCGTPDFTTACAGHRIIDLPESLAHLAYARWFADLAKSAFVSLKARSYQVRLQLALEGNGLACLPRFAGDLNPGLCRLETPQPSPLCSLWLSIRNENRSVRRVRVVIEFIAQTVKERLIELQYGASNDSGPSESRAFDFADDALIQHEAHRDQLAGFRSGGRALEEPANPQLTLVSQPIFSAALRSNSRRVKRPVEM